MRNAGSTFNDIADRKFDAHVERTRFRPLAGGQLQTHQALVFLIVELALSASLLIFLTHSPAWPAGACAPRRAAIAATTSALAQRVEVDTKEVRVLGSKSELLRTLVAAESAKSAGFGVPSFVPKWRATQNKTANSYVIEIVI
jgi:hypothetical protein